MNADLILTGISVGYDGNLLYECSKPDVITDFRAFLDSTELKRIDRVYLWYHFRGMEVFLLVEPVVKQECNTEWTVESEEAGSFVVRHTEGKNLLDEIEKELPDKLIKINPFLNIQEWHQHGFL